MKAKALIAAGIILALLTLAICGIGLYRQVGGSGAIEATIVLSD